MKRRSQTEARHRPRHSESAAIAAQNGRSDITYAGNDGPVPSNAGVRIRTRAKSRTPGTRSGGTVLAQRSAGNAR